MHLMQRVKEKHRTQRAGLFVAAMLAVAGMATVPARAAASPATPIVQAFQAMYSATSFRATMTSVESLGKSNASRSTGEMIIVRQGKVFTYYLKLTMHQQLFGKTSTRVTEVVSTATHTCMREQQHGAWDCHAAAGTLFMAGFTPDALRKASARIKQVTPLGTQTVDGQLCRGYRFLVSGEQTSLWISAATQRLVLINIADKQAATGQSGMSTSITETFSDWNDPSLKIPAV